MMGGIIYGCAINTAKEQWIIKGFKHFNFSMLTLLMGYDKGNSLYYLLKNLSTLSNNYSQAGNNITCH